MTTPRQRLAAVVGKCFETKSHNAANDLRHAAYSQFVGREIRTSADLTDAEVEQMLTNWEDWLIPFKPSDEGRRQVNDYARLYQEAHGQTQFQL